jgi:hypothetical protein
VRAREQQLHRHPALPRAQHWRPRVLHARRLLLALPLPLRRLPLGGSCRRLWRLRLRQWLPRLAAHAAALAEAQRHGQQHRQHAQGQVGLQQDGGKGVCKRPGQLAQRGGEGGRVQHRRHAAAARHDRHHQQEVDHAADQVEARVLGPGAKAGGRAGTRQWQA